MKYKNSQSSIEFMILTGFILFILVTFLLIIQENMSSNKYQSQSLQIKELALDVQNEINLALESSDGYQRSFNIPNQVANLDYKINISEGMVYIRTENGRHALALPVPNLVGDVNKGANTIKKENGEIKLNFVEMFYSSFNNGGLIGPKYTCGGLNISFPLHISETPAGTQSFAIIFYDPDADFNHWLLWNISSGISDIAENSVPAGAIQGINDYGVMGYSGPCPPTTHKYSIKLYALDNNINLPAGSMRPDLDSNISGHIIKTEELIGYYG